MEEGSSRSRPPVPPDTSRTKKPPMDERSSRSLSPAPVRSSEAGEQEFVFEDQQQKGPAAKKTRIKETPKAKEDTRRDSFRKALCGALLTAAAKLGDHADGTAAIAAKAAKHIERRCFKTNAGSEYSVRVRSLVFNVKNNPKLAEGLKDGTLTSAKLTSLDPDLSLIHI